MATLRRRITTTQKAESEGNDNERGVGGSPALATVGSTRTAASGAGRRGANRAPLRSEAQEAPSDAPTTEGRRKARVAEKERKRRTRQPSEATRGARFSAEGGAQSSPPPVWRGGVCAREPARPSTPPTHRHLWLVRFPCNVRCRRQ